MGMPKKLYHSVQPCAPDAGRIENLSRAGKGRDTNQRAGEKIPAGDENEICWWWGSFFTKGRSPAGRDTNRGTGLERWDGTRISAPGKRSPPGTKVLYPPGWGSFFNRRGKIPGGLELA